MSSETAYVYNSNGQIEDYIIVANGKTQVSTPSKFDADGNRPYDTFGEATNKGRTAILAWTEPERVGTGEFADFIDNNGLQKYVKKSVRVDHDNNGNRTKDSDPEKITKVLTTRAFDVRNRLTKVSYRLGGSTTYSLDTFDRIAVRNPELVSQLRFAYDGRQLAGELDRSGAYTLRYLRGPDGSPLARVDETGPHFYLTDRQGSVLQVARFEFPGGVGLGVTLKRTAYRQTQVNRFASLDNSYRDRLGISGGWADESTGATLIDGAWLDTKTGRFLTEANGKRINPYPYADNAPVQYDYGWSHSLGVSTSLTLSGAVNGITLGGVEALADGLRWLTGQAGYNYELSDEQRGAFNTGTKAGRPVGEALLTLAASIPGGLATGAAARVVVARLAARQLTRRGSAAVGAILGAGVNTGVTAAQSYATTGQLPTRGQLAGAAVSGAVGGALGGAIGFGPAGLTYLGSLTAGAAGGAAGGVAGLITQRLIDGQTVDLNAVRVAYFAGGLGGALGGGLFRATGPRIGLLTRTGPGGELQMAGLACGLGFWGAVGFSARHALVGGIGAALGDAAAQGIEIGLGWGKPNQKFDWDRVWAAGVAGAAGGAASYAAMRLGFQACFAAGTPLRTPTGSVMIETIRAGDLVLSRDEHDPDGLVVAQTVEEVFTRQALVMHLHLPHRVVIRTTAEHPFYERAKGWVACQELTAGDALLCEDGTWVAVGEVFDTGCWETVYNLRVADFHTYFVGCDEWGFGVWAHNSGGCTLDWREIRHGSSLRLTEGQSKWVLRQINERLSQGATAESVSQYLTVYLAKRGVSPQHASALHRQVLENIAPGNTFAKQAANALEAAEHGHSIGRHGPEVTDAALQARLTTGIAPDGVFSPAPRSSRFADYETWLHTRETAFQKLRREPGFKDAPGVGDQTKFRLLTEYFEDVGIGYSGRIGTETKVTVGGKKGKVFGTVDGPSRPTSVTSTFEWDGSAWRVRQHFPGG